MLHVQKRQLAEISNEQKFVRSGKDSCTWKENIFDPIKHINMHFIDKKDVDQYYTV
jgi:hypothetical protein